MEFPFSKGSRPKKTRKGSVPMNIDTLMKQKRYEKGKVSSLQFFVFSQVLQEKWAAGEYNPTYNAPLAGTVSDSGIKRSPVDDTEELSYEEIHRKKNAEDVSRDEAIDAAKSIKEKKRSLGRHAGEVGLLSGTATPLVSAAARAAKGFVDTKGGIKARLGGAGRGIASATLGDVASQVVGGGLTGVVMTGARGGLQIAKAKKKVKSYISRPGRQRGERKIKKILKGN